MSASLALGTTGAASRLPCSEVVGEEFGPKV